MNSAVLWKEIQNVIRVLPPEVDMGFQNWQQLLKDTIGIDFKTDFIGSFGDRVVMLQYFKKPYNAMSMKQVFILEIKDKAKVSKFITHLMGLAPIFSKVDYLGNTIYYLDLSRLMGGAGNPADPEATMSAMSLTVTDGKLMYANSLAGLKAVLRNIAKPKNALADSEHYKIASRDFPERALMIAYQNLGPAVEWLVTCLKQKEDPNQPRGFAPMQNPFLVMSRELREFVDFNLLPPAEKFKKYLGASVGWAVRTEDGVLFKSIERFPKEDADE